MPYKDKAKKLAYQREWNERNRDKRREYNRVYQREWSRKNREKRKLASQKSEALVKEQVLTHYGNGKLSCLRCGFTDIRALSIDHINGGGTKHRKVLKVKWYCLFFVWLRKNHYPEGYQTLCMNCQVIKKRENNEYADKGN